MREPWPVPTAFPLLWMFESGDHGHVGWVVAVSDALANNEMGRDRILARVSAWYRGAEVDWCWQRHGYWEAS